jgi:hypothetical protein
VYAPPLVTTHGTVGIAIPRVVVRVSFDPAMTGRYPYRCRRGGRQRVDLERIRERH